MPCCKVFFFTLYLYNEKRGEILRDFSLLDKILFSLRYNDSISHNVFFTINIVLTIIFFIVAASLLLSKTSKLKLFIIGFWILIFPWGLFLLIDVGLSDVSDTSAMGKAYIYELNGRPVATMVVEKFEANETEDNIVSGSSYYKIQAIDLEKGKPVFDNKLPESKSSLSEPRILGSSKDYLFTFFDSKILIIDKVTGKTIKSISSVENLKDVSLLSSQQFCKFDNKAEAVVFKSSDGLVYSMNINSFDISEKPNIDPSKYFENDKDESFDTNFGKGLVSICEASQKGDFSMFLTESDIKDISKGLQISGSGDKSERRFLYSGNLDDMAGLKKVSQDVFLLGGFLGKYAPDDKGFNKIDSKNKNYQNYINISYRSDNRASEPFKVKGSNLSFIVHKKSLETNADTLFTAIDLQRGKMPWTIDTRSPDIQSCYEIDKDHILLLCSKLGSNKADFMLYVSLKDAAYIGYEFKYGNNFKSQ